MLRDLLGTSELLEATPNDRGKSALRIGPDKRHPDYAAPVAIVRRLLGDALVCSLFSQKQNLAALPGQERERVV